MRGQPEAYDELKKIVSVSLTPTALAGIDKISRDYKISRSELLERIGRSIIQIKDRDDWANQSQS
ncbi:CopG domain protein DNA-binding domain protein [Anabaenopsis circularis NIES-21]|uniref:CopG domain protein DNA-binding domain protein n=1 Tax=Anabaenopsis circularis NIES-21 TaxID=1085406 RepID=A0A1Z4GCM7_9CYAN|nr:CopG domain protein DNA-binding domain protein [Anabaenopsis circularis NIES-21]